jgi:serine/threonine protein phosphatase 1
LFLKRFSGKPMTQRRFVIPDIHGCARTFSALVHDVLGLRITDSLYLLGDYIDRGPRSKQVIDQILSMQREGYSISAVRGNHEEMALRACGNLDFLRLWKLNGGQKTLECLGVDDPCEIPDLYRDFFISLPYFLELDDFIVVHAGLNTDAQNPLSDKEAMLWIRPDQTGTGLFRNKKIISGHTMVTRETIKQSISTGRILLDNGCVYDSNPDFGTLAALELNSLSLFFQKNID